MQVEDYPIVVVGVFIENHTQLLDEFVQKVIELSYPKEKIHLFIDNTVRSFDATLN